MDIPRNEYSVESDPRLEKLMQACLDALREKETVLVDMTGRGDPDATHIRCTGDGSDAVVLYVLNKFIARDYHACLYYNGYCHAWAKISRVPFNRTNGVNILG